VCQAVRTVPVNERLPIYDVYLKRASDFFGIGKVCSSCARAVFGVKCVQLLGANARMLQCMYSCSKVF
jgi:hypothetical protein